MNDDMEMGDMFLFEDDGDDVKEPPTKKKKEASNPKQISMLTTMLPTTMTESWSQMRKTNLTTSQMSLKAIKDHEAVRDL